MWKWIKGAIVWIFIGGTALAAGVDALLPNNDVSLSVSDYARVENGVVQYVIRADQKWIDEHGGVSSGVWMEVRKDPTSRKDDADKGDTYDPVLKGFLKKKPSQDAVFDTRSFEWVTLEKQAPHPADFYVASTTPQ